MYTESVLLESRSMRSGMNHRVDVLDKVKALALSPDGVHATTQDVADYFEVSEKAVYNLLSRHRKELITNGLRVLRGSELREYETFNLKVSSGGVESYPQQRNSLAVFTRRTVLNVAMLLRDSEVARRVRAHLLDIEERARTAPAPAHSSAPGYASLDARVSKLESAVADIGSVLQELGPVINRMSVRLERVDHRLEEIDRRTLNTERLVCAMSHRLSDVEEEMHVMRGDLNRVMRFVGLQPTRRRSRV